MKDNTFRLIGIFLFSAIILASCNNNKNHFDASGSFEAVETIISSEASGTIKELQLKEGESLQKGQKIGFIDTLQLHLKKKQLQAQVNAILSKKPNIATQTASLQEQLKTLEKEQLRFSNLVKADAATPKQLDDINAQIEIVKKQIDAQQSALGITSEGINQETVPFQIQIEQINDQLAKCYVVNPIEGTVLSKYAEVNEITAAGKPLYKIADISTLILRAYITANQLSQIKLNQAVKVMVDNGKDAYKEYEGTITWINDKAEFTPKTIQTKDERANMVYAIKIEVKNDGFLKLGMYAEVNF